MPPPEKPRLGTLTFRLRLLVVVLVGFAVSAPRTDSRLWELGEILGSVIAGSSVPRG